MPIYRPFLQLSQVFTPRLRGCIQKVDCSRAKRTIYPASAGVYPGGWCVRRLRTHLPRARGGCSPCTLLLTIYTPIYPAHARMFPNSNHIFDHCGYLPRARGDVPTNSDATEHVDAIGPTHVCAPHVKNRTNEFLVISQLPIRYKNHFFGIYISLIRILKINFRKKVTQCS